MQNATHNQMQHAQAATHGVVADALALPSALLASVSHDLRNPLSVILGASEVLHDSFVHLADDDRHAYLRAIRRECVRMDEYVQGLFSATRLFVGGSARLACDWIGIDEIVGSAVERLRRYRDEARVRIDIASPLRPVHANGPFVEQAVLNVLDNAVKFSPPNTPVELRIAQDAAANTRIDVTDAGPGIAPDQREHVFGMFVSDDPQSLGRAGSGLGLAISRGILRAHGGDVTACAPECGRVGTRVVLTLPMQEAVRKGAR
ncbi:Osmosensitive K [Lysobacter dokdonensis DS-58]|uniref:histidine kinase n=1 Tax=Lysobacter dokdonensis DS-58 TaxID=1300345 RepID=A0A0A2WZ21_9GAMM|nr:ATP-binding protein [Lysobacter dokdonensis]KGQ18209.1 Osmosensitive K [Lysobacter dokdonensis DS-58]